jgi:hypothetical protein
LERTPERQSRPLAGNRLTAKVSNGVEADREALSAIDRENLLNVLGPAMGT